MSKNKTFSYLKGFSFTFEDEGKDIRAWFSALSGLEKVYVGDQLVSSQRNYSKNSSSEFCIGDNNYTVNMLAVSLLKGPFVCTLSKNGEPYRRQKVVFSKQPLSTLGRVLRIGFGAALGLIYFYLEKYWQLPSEYFYYFIAIVFLVFLVIHMHSGPTIEEETV